MVVNCTKCGSENWVKTGLDYRDGVRNVQRRRCKDCGKIFCLDKGVFGALKGEVDKAEVKQEKK